MGGAVAENGREISLEADSRNAPGGRQPSRLGQPQAQGGGDLRIGHGRVFRQKFGLPGPLSLLSRRLWPRGRGPGN